MESRSGEVRHATTNLFAVFAPGGGTRRPLWATRARTFGLSGEGHGHGGLHHRASGRTAASVGHRRPSKATSSAAVRWARRVRAPGSKLTVAPGQFIVSPVWRE